DGLSDDAAVVRALAEAANAVRAEHGRLDVAWGDEYRLRAPGLDLPANGMSDPFGVFRATGYTETEDGRHAARFGDSFVAAVEFGEAVRARLAYLRQRNTARPVVTGTDDAVRGKAAQASTIYEGRSGRERRSKGNFPGAGSRVRGAEGRRQQGREHIHARSSTRPDPTQRAQRAPRSPPPPPAARAISPSDTPAPS